MDGHGSPVFYKLVLVLLVVNDRLLLEAIRPQPASTCQTTIRSGEVVYHQPPDYDPEPGTCLLCVCVPKSSVTLEA